MRWCGRPGADLVRVRVGVRVRARARVGVRVRVGVRLRVSLRARLKVRLRVRGRVGSPSVGEVSVKSAIGMEKVGRCGMMGGCLTLSKST